MVTNQHNNNEKERTDWKHRSTRAVPCRSHHTCRLATKSITRHHYAITGGNALVSVFAR